MAALGGNPAVVKWLVDDGADVNVGVEVSKDCMATWRIVMSSLFSWCDDGGWKSCK